MGSSCFLGRLLGCNDVDTRLIVRYNQLISANVIPSRFIINGPPLDGLRQEAGHTFKAGDSKISVKTLDSYKSSSARY